MTKYMAESKNALREALKQKQEGFMRKDKESYYLDIAQTVASRSTCLRRKVGAIIVSNDVILSTGYNGAPRSRANCNDLGVCERERLGVPHGERYELCRSVHAEANAIINAGRSKTVGAIMYLAVLDADTGKPVDDAGPCDMCRRIIINAGIAQVISRTSDGVKRYFRSELIAEEGSLYGDGDRDGR